MVGAWAKSARRPLIAIRTFRDLIGTSTLTRRDCSACSSQPPDPRQDRRLEEEGHLDAGVVPFGYRTENRALHVVEEHAVFVRDLYRRYLEIGSVGSRFR